MKVRLPLVIAVRAASSVATPASFASVGGAALPAPASVAGGSALATKIWRIRSSGFTAL